MSSSAYPRLYLSGHFYWNPSTYNNDDYSSSGDFKNPLVPYNAAEARPTWDTFLHRNRVNRENFRKWSQELFDLGADPQGNPQKLPPPEWNFFGGNQCGFVTPEEPRIEAQYGFTKPQKVTLTTGYTGLDGTYHDTGDPWLGQSMQFNPGGSAAKLVDVNPTVPWSSQIFADRFVFGTAGNGFSAPVKHRMHSRWVGGHNLNQDKGLMIAGPFSAVFQTCFDKKEIEWSGGGGLYDAFKRVLFEAPGHKNVAGLMLRFLSYDTLYFHGLLDGPTSNQFPGMVKMCQLYVQYFEALDEFEQGKRAQPPAPPCNPAYSRVIGWIGPWYRGELVSMPSGRLLLPIVNPNQPTTPALPVPQQLTPQEQAKTGNFGPAAVERVAKNGKLQRVTIDLASTLPELNSKGEFAGYGSVQLAIVLPGRKEPVRLATLIEDTASPEQYDAYHRKAGLVDVDASGFPVTLEQFDNNPLVLLAHSYSSANASATQVIALTENPLVAQTDERGVYANEPDAGHEGPTTGFKIQVRHFGRPPASTIGLAVTQYGTAWGAPVNEESALLQLYLRDQRWGVIPFGNQQLVDASSGEVEIGVRAKHPGLRVGHGMPNVTFYPVAHSLVRNTRLGPSKPVIDVSSAKGVTIPSYQNSANGAFTSLFYNVVRVLPFDNTRAMSFTHWLNDVDNPPGIDEVNLKIFDEIFMDIFLMYPVMDFIKSPQKFQEWRGRILQVVDPARFESSAYMPVMRNLSSGKYRMLKAYDAYVSGAKEGALRHRRARSRAFKRG